MALKEAKSSNSWLDWAYKEEDPPYPGNGGLECKDFLSISQQCWENAVASVLALLALLYAYPRLRLPQTCPCACDKPEPMGKRILLLLLCLAFGVELGVKLAARRMFWIGKPGYLAIMLQIFILAAPPSRIVTAAFRLQMHMLIGVPLVVFFPITNPQMSAFEIGVSVFQHLLMVVIPFYLMHTGDPFIPEALGDFSWALIAFVFLFLYHFLPLQLLAYVSQVNLNSILYPALLGPNQSRLYHLLAFCHQLILIPTFGKLLVIIAKAFNILSCSNSLDATNTCTTFKKQRHCCRGNCCSEDVWKQQSSASGSAEDYNTDEDSGCVGSWSKLNSTSRRCPGSNTQNCTCCSGYRSSRGRSCPHRSCWGDHREFNWCCNSDSVHTRCIVNGELIDGVRVDETPCKRWAVDTPSSNQGKSSAPGTGKNLCRSFLLNDSLDSSPEVQEDRTMLASDLETSRNNYIMSH